MIKPGPGEKMFQKNLTYGIANSLRKKINLGKKIQHLLMKNMTPRGIHFGVTVMIQTHHGVNDLN